MNVKGSAPIAAAGFLYPSQVAHKRFVTPFYQFHYRVFYLLLDIDQIDLADQNLRFFSRNRFNLLSLYDADHGTGELGGLRLWAERMMRESGIEPDGGRIRLLCMPRLFGFVFNPISLWYCEARDGSLRAVIAEVRNTFSEKHSYVLASGGAPIAYEIALEKEKCFHVSPFFDLTGRYRFELSEPGAHLRVHIHETRDSVPILDASVSGQRRELNDSALLWQVLKMPLMTLKVVAGIHWEALKIWLRGGKYHAKPEPPARERS